MLKIKDNVNLEELERFNPNFFGIASCDWLFGNGCLRVFTHNRHIYYNNIESANLLFDLISAGLVEKV